MVLVTPWRLKTTAGSCSGVRALVTAQRMLASCQTSRRKFGCGARCGCERKSCDINRALVHGSRANRACGCEHSASQAQGLVFCSARRASGRGRNGIFQSSTCCGAMAATFAASPEGMGDALVEGAKSGDVLAVAKLLDAGAPPNWRGGVRLGDIVGTARIECCQPEGIWFTGGSASHGVRLHAACVAVSPQDGWTSLMWAASEGANEVVGLLLDYGADLEARDDVRQSSCANWRGGRGGSLQTWSSP